MLPRANGNQVVDLSGSTYNRLAEAAERVLRVRGKERSLSDLLPPGTILAAPTGLDDYTVGQVVGIGGTHDTLLSGLDSFLTNNIAICTAALTQDAHQMGRWGVVMSPMPQELRTCLVQQWGVASVQLVVTDVNAEYVDVNAANQLAALHYGSARILWKESGTGTKWAKIFMGDVCHVVHGVFKTATGEGVDAPLTIRRNGAETTHTVTAETDIYTAEISANKKGHAQWFPHERAWKVVGVECDG